MRVLTLCIVLVLFLGCAHTPPQTPTEREQLLQRAQTILVSLDLALEVYLMLNEDGKYTEQIKLTLSRIRIVRQYIDEMIRLGNITVDQPPWEESDW